MRFAAYRASTRGVEQSFSHLQWLQSQKRSCSSEQAELDAMTLRLDLPKDEHASVINGLANSGGSIMAHPAMAESVTSSTFAHAVAQTVPTVKTVHRQKRL